MKFVALVSSGIDSPVSAYLLAKKADELIFVHVDNQLFTDASEVDHFKLIAQYLKKHISCAVKIYIVQHGPALAAYKKHADPHFTCIFCKRMMVRYAEIVAQKEKACAIIMGDSLGQVASQTIQNIRVVEQAVSIPILRPLIGLDKEEITKIAQQIGTYEFSIIKSTGCSAVPNKPSTKAKIEQILDEEKKINLSLLTSSISIKEVTTSLLK